MAIAPQSDASGHVIQVLGPVAVSGNGTSADLGGPKQRLLLALLLVHAGEVVRTDALIDGLWGEDPPATARKAVQVHVSNLRRSLGDDFPLRTAPGGYVIQPGALDFDAAAFENDLAGAKARLRTDPLAAERLLTEAVGRWHGPAYADLDHEPVLRAEIVRLEELRLQALELRAEAAMRVGRHADLVGELTTLCAEHPYREKVTELLMLALYRSGRQAEALRAYERTRSVLADELGVDPGPALQDLHHQILDHSAELALDEDAIENRFAFLATDIESSTAMWEADPEAMQDAVARHDEILAAAVNTNAGTVFKGTGDGVFAVFAGVADALQAAVDAQHALANEPWPTERPIRVRMGVDEGAAAARGGDYFGPALNRVSRIMSSGHGGQILCPADLAPQAPTPSRQLGATDYKGIGRLDVAQLEVVGLPVDFPELETDRAPKTLAREGFGRAIRGYELREQLGAGAHGVVYRAYQAAIGREVAIKVIRPEHANQSEFVKRFEAEAQFVAQLEHPHIVSLYDYWRDPEGAYLVMQLLRGGSLAGALERAQWRPPAAMKMLDQIGAALEYAHRQGVLHRDLKPANVLLDGEGNAYLSDFGIAARHIHAVGMPVHSTVTYVSPEELAGGEVGRAADMYGLALLAHETLTGDRPPLGGQPTPVSELRADLPASLDEVIGKATAPEPAKRFDRVDDFLRALRRALGADVVTHERRVAAADVRNPYKGLRAFAETDADDFCGRDDLVEELAEHVATHRLTAVVGPSGSGKSSLVRAGLIPRIRRQSGGGAGEVLVTDMFPGSYPFEELEAALLRVGVAHQDGLLGELVADDNGLLRMSKRLLPDDGSELLLVIDQFEELFLLTHDDEIRRRFLDSLVTVATDERSRVRLVVTIRADHFDRPLSDPAFGSLIRNSVVPVAMPTHEELARAISEPAAAAGLDFESGLIPRIVGDVADEPGALPLLQYALTELVRSRDGTELTTKGYERIGGVEGALTQRAEEIFQGLGEAARDATREVFLRLVAVDEAGDDTRRRARRSELESLGLGEAALAAALDGFGSFRLLSFDRDPLTRGPTVEVAHEALIREWGQLRTWIDERREDLLLERRLEAASAEWDTNGRDPSYLFAGGKHDQYQEWASSTEVRLTELEREFLDDSRRAQDEADTRRRRRRGSIMAALGLLTVLACAAAMLALVQRNEANRSADRAEAEAEVADRLSGEATVLQQEALDALAAEQRARALTDAQVLAGRAAERFDEDQDEGLLLVAAAADLLEAFDLELAEVTSALMEAAVGRRPLHQFDLTPLDRVEFGGAASRISSDPSGGPLAVVVPSGVDGGTAVEIRDVSTGDLLSTLDTVENPVSVFWDTVDGRILVGGRGTLESVDPVSGDRRTLVSEVEGDLSTLSTTDDHIVYLAHVPAAVGTGNGFTTVVAGRDGVTLAEFPDHFWVSLSPSGDLLARYPVRDDFGDTNTAIVETYPGGEPVATGAKAAVFGWTAAGELLSLNRTELGIEVWRPGETDGPARRVELPGPLGLYPTARLSPDGRWIAVEAGVGIVQVHDVETLEQVLDPPLAPGIDDRQIPLTWSGDSRHLVTVDAAAVASVWDLAQPGGAVGARSLATGIEPGSLAWLPDDRLLLGALDGSWELWDRDTGTIVDRRPAANLAVGQSRVTVAERNGFVAATAGAGQGITVEELASGEESVVGTGRFDQPLAFGPRGRLLAVSNHLDLGRALDSRPFGLLNLETGATVFDHEPPPDGSLSTTASFSPSGEFVVFGVAGPSADAAHVLAFDTATGTEVARHSVNGGGVTSVTFSPDGTLLAFATFVGEIELHDSAMFLASGDSLVGAAYTGRSDPLTHLTFSEEGSTVYVGQVEFNLLTQTAGRSRIMAWSGGEEPKMLWSLEGTNIVGVRDGSLWLFAGTSLDLEQGGRASNLIGIPLDRSELAEFVRSKAARTLTEVECQRHFRSSCAAFDARVD